ncbi:MAG: hypothetical protein HFJ25_02850 [Clostridia bacterium]|nr:hypothetical protein [Clostridia bacterium]
MKKSNLTNVLFKVIAVLAIVLVSLISFFGVYKRNLNSWENILPDYNLSKDLGESRTFGFVVDNSTKEGEHHHEEGEEHSDDEEVEQIPVNDQSVLTTENYKKTKNIVEARLKNFGIIDTIVSVNEKTGELAITASHSRTTDKVVEMVTNQGKIEIVDSETKEVLISKDKIKKATAYYVNSNENATGNSSETPSYDLGVRLEFNQEGQKKLNEISKTYIETTDAEGKATQKTVTVKVNDEDRYVTYFTPDGAYTYLAVPLHQSVKASNDNMEEFNDAYNDCLIAQVAINEDTLPIVYELSKGTYFESSFGENFLRNVVIVLALVLVLISIIIIVKFKKNGLIAAIIEMGYIAILLLLIRAASVNITLVGLIMIAFMAAVNYLLSIMLMNKEKVRECGKFILNLIPFIITILVFNFAKDINIRSIGMVGVWGIISFIYTFVFSAILLNNRNTKKNGVESNEK